MKKPIFVTLEGGEGSSKSSIIKELKKHYGEKNFLFLNDPSSNSEELKALRSIILSAKYKFHTQTEFLLYNAARAELVHKFIKPALKKGKSVICDRFVDSTRIYQGMFRGHSKQKINLIHHMFCEGIMPDLTFMCDVTAKTGLVRSNKKLNLENIDEGRWESLGLEFHEKINSYFLELYQKERNNGRWVYLDSENNSIKCLTSQAIYSINNLYNKPNLL